MTTGLHVQIDSEIYRAFVEKFPTNDRTYIIERMLAKLLKLPAPERRLRGRPKKSDSVDSRAQQ